MFLIGLIGFKPKPLGYISSVSREHLPFDCGETPYGK